MRALGLIAASLCLACATGLSRGDDAFARRQWQEAQVAWNTVEGHDDQVALRLALLHALPQSELHDEEKARTLMGIVRRQWPDSLAGFVAARWLETDARLQQALQRQSELESALAVVRQALQREEELAADDRAEATLELEQAEDQRQRLVAELERLRAELRAMQSLQAESDTLREELEALKSIDLRR